MWRVVQLHLHRLGITVLGILDEEYHQEGDNRRTGIDHELPGIAEPEEWPVTSQARITPTARMNAGGLPATRDVALANRVNRDRDFVGRMGWSCPSGRGTPRSCTDAESDKRHPVMTAAPAPRLRGGAEPRSPGVVPAVATLGARPRIARVPRVGTPPAHHAAAGFTDWDHRVAIVGASSWAHGNLPRDKVQRVSEVL
jgi:hypothetical protein